MFKFMYESWYKLLVVFVVIPLNGFMFHENPLLSTVLLVTQVPWFYSVCCKKGV
ncbi:hypothetical protein VP277E431_P0089 [Vibrio phage 277E43-1]|nr:hypothetical protein VP277E431_P0089 [Vibrio phage 277E43-1]